jgi:sugar lactone lactonase YvrE
MALTKPRAYQIYDLDYKQATRVITVSNITLSGGAPSQVDGVNLSLNDRALVIGQTNKAQNGIYVVTNVGSGANGTWARSNDTNQTGELDAGTIVMVTEGLIYADTQWKLTTDDPIVIGVSELIFEQNSAFAFGNVYANGTAVLANSVGSTISLTAGNNISISGNNSSKTVTIGVTGISLNSISNGTSNVNVVSSGGDVTVGVAGISNVAVFSPTGLAITGNIDTVGNVTANNVILVGTQSSSALQNNNDITGWYWTGNSFSVSSQETGPSGIFFKPDGTKMFISGTTGDDITEYDLSTAWDITTASFAGQSVNLGEATLNDLFINNDGTKCYVLGSSGDAVREFDFGTPWQANTLSFVRSFSVSAEETAPTGITFTPDLAQMFVCGTTGDGVDIYSLSSPGNIATATFSTFVSLSSQDTAPQAIQFNSDGTRFYMLGGTGDDVNRYDLTTPYDLTTATFFNNSFYWGFIEASPAGLFINFDVNKAWIVGSSADQVREIETRGDGLRATGDSNYFDGYVYVGKDLDVRGNAVVENTFNVLGSTTLSSTTLTSTVTLSTTTGTIGIGTSQTTGTTIIGGTSQTGDINIGRSTVNQGIVIGNGITASGSVKTIDIGTLGASGSNTTITIGSATEGAVTTTTIHGNANVGNLGVATIVATTLTGTLSTASQPNITSVGTLGSLNVTGNITGGNITGNGAGLTGINAFSNISVTGGNSAVADSIADTLTLTAGSGITLVMDSGTDTLTIAATGGSEIFVDGSDFGTVTEIVTLSDDLGLVTEAVEAESDLGTIVTSGLIYPDQFVLPSFTTTTLPSASVIGAMIYVTNESGGAVPAFADGTNWRRVKDRAIVS